MVPFVQDFLRELDYGFQKAKLICCDKPSLNTEQHLLCVTWCSLKVETLKRVKWSLHEKNVTLASGNVKKITLYIFSASVDNNDNHNILY